MNRYVKLAALLVMCSVSVSSASSIFSYHPEGVGWWSWPSTARTAGMAGSTVAIYDEMNTIGVNPATNAGLDRTAMLATLLSQSRRVVDTADRSANFYDQYPRVGRVVTPTWKGVVLSFGFEPMSDIMVKWSSRTLEPSGITLIDSLEANGGLWSGSAGLARAFGKFAVGADVKLIRGNAQTEWRRTVIHVDTTTSPLATSTLLDRQYSGVRTAVGALYRVGETSRRRARFVVGAFAELPTSLNRQTTVSTGTRIPSYYYPSHKDYYAVAEDLDDTTSVSVDLPFALGVGASFRPSEQFLAAADIVYMNWSALSSSFANTWSASIGIEVHPTTNYRAFYPFQWPYRFGARMEEHYIRAGGAKPTAWYLSSGVGIPLGHGTGFIEYAFEYGVRGNTTDNLVRERVWRHTISLTGWERWFQYQPRR